MANARDTGALLLHVLHKLVRVKLGIACPLELPCCIIDGASETGPDRQKPADQAGHQILACSRGHNRIVRACIYSMKIVVRIWRGITCQRPPQ